MPETDKSIIIAEIDENQMTSSNTGQSVLKSKGLYRAVGHFTGLVRRYLVSTESGSFRPDYLFAPGRFAPGLFASESESIRPS